MAENESTIPKRPLHERLSTDTTLMVCSWIHKWLIHSQAVWIPWGIAFGYWLGRPEDVYAMWLASTLPITLMTVRFAVDLIVRAIGESRATHIFSEYESEEPSRFEQWKAEHEKGEQALHDARGVHSVEESESE